MTSPVESPKPFERVNWPVRTERLTIRPATSDDADALFAIRADEEVSRWLTSWPRDPEAWAVKFAEGLDTTLVVERGRIVIGELMLRVGDAWAQHEVAQQGKGVQAELGWVFDPAYGGQGFATEAVVAAVGVCFGPLGLRRVEANCFADNEPSWRLMERIGMRREVHTRAESLHRDGTWHDGLGYALLADEWHVRPGGDDDPRH